MPIGKKVVELPPKRLVDYSKFMINIISRGFLFLTPEQSRKAMLNNGQKI